jgi:vanillate O-demethylase monooxygenase subunit
MMVPDREVVSTLSRSDGDILSHFWDPVAGSHRVTDTPAPTTLLNQKIVIYRQIQGVTVATDLGPHRGGPLSPGRLVWTCLDRQAEPRLPHFPEEDDTTFVRGLPDVWNIRAVAGRQLDAFLDGARVTWMLTMTFGDGGDHVVPKYGVEPQPQGFRSSFALNASNFIPHVSHRAHATKIEKIGWKFSASESRNRKLTDESSPSNFYYKPTKAKNST